MQHAHGADGLIDGRCSLSLSTKLLNYVHSNFLEKL